MKTLVLKDRMGKVIRTFFCKTDKICLVYRPKKGRLDLCSSPDFFEKEKDSLILLKQFELGQLRSAQPIPSIQAVLELCDDISNIRPSLPRSISQEKDLFVKSFGFVLFAYLILISGFYLFSGMDPAQEKNSLEQQIVKIIKPPVIVKPEKVVVGSNQMFLRNAKAPVQKILKKSLKKMGALSALGSLSKKDTFQKGGLNLGASKTSKGPGLRSISSVSSSGGVQSSLYSKGMITAALGTGGNIRGGGGHGTKGTKQGGGSAGYGELTLIGSGGTEDLSSSSVLSSEGGGFDSSMIDRQIIKHIGKIRQCYDVSLKRSPDLKGLLKINFLINSRGIVASSKVHPNSQVRVSEISSCILNIINQIKFPIKFSGDLVSIDYAFDLSALETEGGE